MSGSFIKASKITACSFFSPSLRFALSLCLPFLACIMIYFILLNFRIVGDFCFIVCYFLLLLPFWGGGGGSTSIFIFPVSVVSAAIKLGLLGVLILFSSCLFTLQTDGQTNKAQQIRN